MAMYKISCLDKDYYKPTADEICKKLQKICFEYKIPFKVSYSTSGNDVIFILTALRRIPFNNTLDVMNQLLAKCKIKCAGFKAENEKIAKCIISSNQFRL